MAKNRMRNKGDDLPLAIEGRVTAHGMVPSVFARLSSSENVSTLSDVLVELLNGDELRDDYRERVVRIISLLRLQRSFESYGLDAMRSGESAESTTVQAFILSNVDYIHALNDELLRYKITPQFFSVSGSTAIVYFVPADSLAHSPEYEAELGAVTCVLQLAQHGQIEMVRQCPCGTFFVAGRIDQNHCKTQCRVKAHQSSDEFRAKRRAADRERYRLHKKGKVKESNRRKSNGTQKTR